MYSYYYKYFAIPTEYGSQLKSHVIQPHTEMTLCGWDTNEMDSHSLSDDLRQDCSLCVRCIDSLKATLEARGIDVVALHVWKALVGRLRRLEQE